MELVHQQRAIKDPEILNALGISQEELQMLRNSVVGDLQREGLLGQNTRQISAGAKWKLQQIQASVQQEYTDKCKARKVVEPELANKIFWQLVKRANSNDRRKIRNRKQYARRSRSSSPASIQRQAPAYPPLAPSIQVTMLTDHAPLRWEVKRASSPGNPCPEGIISQVVEAIARNTTLHCLEPKPNGGFSIMSDYSSLRDVMGRRLMVSIGIPRFAWDLPGKSMTDLFA